MLHAPQTPDPRAPHTLQDPRWKELDNSLLLLLIDGLTAHKYRPSNTFSLVAEQWKEMGDLTQGMAAATLSAAGAFADAELDAAEGAQQAQAAVDWEAEFDAPGGEFTDEEEDVEVGDFETEDEDAGFL